MKHLLKIITNNNIRILAKPMMLEFFQSILLGQPYFIISLVILEFVKPLQTPGIQIDIGELTKLTGLLALALFVLFIVGRYTYVEENSTAYYAAAEGRIALGERLRKLPMGFFKGRDPGDITALLLQDYTNIETMLSHLLMDAIGSIALPLVFLLFLFPIDWRMTLVIVSVLPFALIVAKIPRWNEKHQII